MIMQELPSEKSSSSSHRRSDVHRLAGATPSTIRWELGDATPRCVPNPRSSRVATALPQPVVAHPIPCHAAFRLDAAGGDAHGRVRGGGASAGAQRPRAAADVGGLLAGHVGPAALHGAPPPRPGAAPGAGVRLPAAGPGGRPRRARGAVAERDPWRGSSKNAAEGPGPAVLARRALLLRRGRGRGRRCRCRRRQVQRAVADRPGGRGARLPGLH